MGAFLSAIRALCGLVFWAAVLIGVGSVAMLILFPGSAGDAGIVAVGMLFLAFFALRLNTVATIGEEGVRAYDQR